MCVNTCVCVCVCVCDVQLGHCSWMEIWKRLVAVDALLLFEVRLFVYLCVCLFTRVFRPVRLLLSCECNLQRPIGALF